MPDNHIHKLITNLDGLVKSLKRRFSVIPVQTGIQYFRVVRILWIPVFTGMTTFYETINLDLCHFGGEWKTERAFYHPLENRWFIEGEADFVWGERGSEFMPITSQMAIYNWFRFVLGGVEQKIGE